VKKAIDEHAEYNTAELDRSRPVKKGATTRRRLGEQVAVNTYTMGTSFVGKERDVRQIAEAQIGELCVAQRTSRISNANGDIALIQNPRTLRESFVLLGYHVPQKDGRKRRQKQEKVPEYPKYSRNEKY